MSKPTLRQLSKERWRSHLAAIMDQAEIEAPQNTGISSILIDMGDNNEGIISIIITNDLLFCYTPRKCRSCFEHLTTPYA